MMHAAEARQSLCDDDFRTVIPFRYQHEVPPELARVILREVRRERHRLLSLLECSYLYIDALTLTAAARGWSVPTFVLTRKEWTLTQTLSAARKIVAPEGTLPVEASGRKMVDSLQYRVDKSRLFNDCLVGRSLCAGASNYTAGGVITHLEQELDRVRHKLAAKRESEALRVAAARNALSVAR